MSSTPARGLDGVAPPCDPCLIDLKCEEDSYLYSYTVEILVRQVFGELHGVLSRDTGVSSQAATQTPAPSSSDDDVDTMLTMRKAKRLAPKGARPPRSESVDTEGAGGPVTAVGSGETDT
jgi:hypothetical protein